MQRIFLALALVLVAFQSLFTQAKPIPGNKPTPSNKSIPSNKPISGNKPSQSSAKRIILGWKGVRSQKDPSGTPNTSGGGELGDVLYIADGTDLARAFATKTGWVCSIDADADAWDDIPKAWVSQDDIKKHKDKSTLYAGAVLFASHTAAGMGPGDDQSPWQMGVRQNHITRLGVKSRCFKSNDESAVPRHHKLDYPGMKDWKISGKPERGP